MENDFKHGVSQVRNDAFVRIRLEVVENLLEFPVSNSRNSIPDEDRGGYTAGIGLKNVNRRLDLVYPGNYHPKLEAMDTEFIIQLSIYLISTHEHKVFVN